MSLRAPGARSALRGAVLHHQQGPRFHHPRLGRALHHRWRVGLRRHRSLRSQAHPARLVRARHARAGAQLLRAGRAAHRASRPRRADRQEPVLLARPRRPHDLPAGDHRHCGHRDRVAYLGRETLLATNKGEMGRRAEQLFCVSDAELAAGFGFFGIPPERVVEMGCKSICSARRSRVVRSDPTRHVHIDREKRSAVARISASWGP